MMCCSKIQGNKFGLRYRKLLVTLFILLFSNLVFAAQTPLGLLSSSSDLMLAELKTKRATIKDHPEVVYGIVRRILLPHFDVQGMARSVLGRDAWFKASSQERAQFTKEFTDLLIRTYSTALAEYTNEYIRFLPARKSSRSQSRRVEVPSQIVRSGAPAISVNYRLIKSGETWKIYDFSVEGVSLLQSYRSQFAPELSKVGLEGLIQKLAVHNRSKP